MANAGSLLRGAAYAALVLFAGWKPEAASAQAGLPAFDTVALCSRSASPPICTLAEGRAEAQLKTVWQGLSAKQQAMCAARASGAGGSYIAALACARMP